MTVFIPQHRLLRAMRNNPECVTYHRSLRSCKSPAATERANVTVSCLSVSKAVKDKGPQMARAFRTLARLAGECFLIVFPPVDMHCIALQSITCRCSVSRRTEGL